MARIRSTLTLVAALALSSAPALAETGKAKPADAEMAKMMELYQKAATPGPMHEHLQKGVGTWEGKVKMWHAPDAPPQESACTTVVTGMLGGRYTRSESSGDMGPMGKFEGFGLYGYDNVTKKFQSAWVDNMGTGLMTGTGDLSADGKTLNWTLTMNDPATGKPSTMREVDRVVDANTWVMEMYGPGPDGKECKVMEIQYTRAKTVAAPKR
jgi:hypothetical protein